MNTSRRDFLKKGALVSSASILGSGAVRAAATAAVSTYDPKGLPTVVLGRTGVRVPRMAVGTGSRFMGIRDEAEALGMLHTALDKGFYYWDTAHVYRSHRRLGQVLKTRRKEVFLASKNEGRNVEEAKRILEASLKDLQTDHIDLYQIHSVEDVNDVKNWESSGLYRQMLKWKEEGVIRFIGFTGHSSAAAMKLAAEKYDFDTMLIALNHQAPNQSFEEKAIPAAAAKGMGILIMKCIRPRESVPGLSVESLIRYGLSLDHVHAAVVGMNSDQVVASNANILTNFKRMDPAEMQQMHIAMAPFFRHQNVPWMADGYVDGLA